MEAVFLPNHCYNILTLLSNQNCQAIVYYVLVNYVNFSVHICGVRLWRLSIFVSTYHNKELSSICYYRLNHVMGK